MQLEEYQFIYEDMKAQIKQQPHLQQLLRLTEKSTRKLQCINLYSTTDKRDFDLQIEEEQITKQIKYLYSKISQLRNKAEEAYSQVQVDELAAQITKNIGEIKQKNIQTFDLLNKQGELLSIEIQTVGYSIEDENEGNFIKQEDEYQQQNMKESNNAESEQTVDKVALLKKQIDQISTKIAKLSGGKGKWYETDHKDFIKIYNKCGGNGKRVIDEGVKVLGMKSNEIMDHLELYENYLQLEKEKKIISEQYKQIRLLQKIEGEERKERERKQGEERKRLKKEREVEQNEKKREEIQKYKEKKNQERVKMMEQQQKKQRQKIIRIPVPAAKKKQIIERNKKYISQTQVRLKKGSEKKEQKMVMQATVIKGGEKSREKVGSRPKLLPGSQSKIKKVDRESIREPIEKLDSNK